MPKTITKIGLSCFRGASQPFELALDPQKDMTMLFGENGSGKSTILDALDIVCNSNLGALEHISRQQQGIVSADGWQAQDKHVRMYLLRSGDVDGHTEPQ